MLNQNFKEKMSDQAFNLPYASPIISTYKRVLGRQPHPGELVHWNSLISANFQIDKLTSESSLRQKIQTLLSKIYNKVARKLGFYIFDSSINGMVNMLIASDEYRQKIVNQNRKLIDIQKFKIYAIVMSFWQKLNNSTIHLDLIAQPL